MSLSSSPKDLDLQSKTQKNSHDHLLIKFIHKFKYNQASQNSPQQPLSNQLSNIALQSDFPSIFSKHRRNDYSGYKQVYINKSKAITFQTDNKEVSRYRTQRKYEINLKNIAKLRKKYSLEPMTHKQKFRDSQFNESLFLPQKKAPFQIEADAISSQRRLDNDLKPMICELKREGLEVESDTQCQRYSSTDIQQIREAKYEISKFHTEKSIHIVNIVEKVRPNKSQLQSQKQISVKLKSKKRFPTLKSSAKQSNIQRSRYEAQLQQETQLCGWQNQSFDSKIASIHVKNIKNK